MLIVNPDTYVNFYAWGNIAMKTTLTLSRETKGTHVFKNDKDDAPIPSLYIAKSAFSDPSNPPKEITVEIKEIK